VLLVAEEIFFVQGVFKFSPAIFFLYRLYLNFLLLIFFIQDVFKFSPAIFFVLTFLTLTHSGIFQMLTW